MSSIKKLLVVLVTFLSIAPLVANAAWVSTGRDTQENPESITDIPITDFDAQGYAELHDTVRYTYYWQEDRDVLAVFDKRNGYTWKTGLDIDPNRNKTAQNTACKDARNEYRDGAIAFATFEERCEIPVDSLTGTITGPLQANSLLYFDYYSKGASDSVYSSYTVFSSYLKQTLYNVDSTLQNIDADPTRWRFTFFSERLGVDANLDLTIVADLTLTADGFKLDLRFDDIVGTCKPFLTSIGVANYMGAVGGVETIYTAIDAADPANADYEDVEDVQRPMIGGYAFVPDGAGALIRFRDNTVPLSRYSAAVYGDDPSQTYQNYRYALGTYVPFKTASVPVYGIAHGDDQAAFVAYATSGAEYMQIVSIPEENVYKYNSTHAKFAYSYMYNKIYTLDGDDPVPSIAAELNDFDIAMNYDFLAGDGSVDGFPANYVGMALKYKAHLVDDGELTVMDAASDHIGIRLDFLMADSETSIVGYQTMIATNAAAVRDILTELASEGIANVSSGLIGWQAKGVTLGNPTRASFASAIGSKTAFRNLIRDFAETGIDISFQQDYYLINEEQISLYRNAAKHPAGWYARLLSYEMPVDTFYYARPVKSVEWLENQAATFLGMDVMSLTVDGMTKHLITDYTGDGTSRTAAIALYREALAGLADDVAINLVKPNGYLFKYADRYLQMDVYTTQYLIETDTVPFLQLVLQGTMELYAIYSNFSFYTTKDVLRMIDYNVWPSFVLTDEPSYVFSDTNSSDYYSTEYELYKELVAAIYGTVDGALAGVIGAAWTNREVLAVGVVRNTYSNGVTIVVNYTDAAFVDGSIAVPAESYVVAGGD